MILKRMKRRHLRADTLAFVERVRAARPDRVFGADLIAGFPTETAAMFDNTLSLVDEAGLSFLHVFPFSPRPGTPAARMPQLPAETVKARAARLRQTAEARRLRWLDSLIGSTQPALIEKGGKGHTDAFAPVFMAGAELGRLGMIRITGRDGDRLTGASA
jgi:threonylcarbamoyladenosine tRNA methylthiotransferase MtaB